MKTLCEPFKIKAVEPLRMTTPEYRLRALEAAGYNTFLLHADDVFIDLLTDSGTGAMSQNQWAAIMRGDESYAGSSSWHRLEKVVHHLTGMEFIFPTHQGRAGERILYGILGGKGKVFISNTHFDTTRANIEITGAIAIDTLECDESGYAGSDDFLGNISVSDSLALIERYGEENIAAFIITLTNNSAGGQPVSLSNIRALSELCRQHNIPLVIDGCRIAENAWFIKSREKGYEHYRCEDIAREIFSLGDAFIMSAKKDGLVNIGGLLCLRDFRLADACRNMLIISEGFTTYGGLAGRDMDALAVGLEEVFDHDYLHYRITSTHYLGKHLKELGIPVVWPIGGHAVYIDAGAWFDKIPAYQFPGQVLVCELYLQGGIRAVETGSVMFGKKDQDGHFIPARKELVRLAIPRRVYTQSHIDYVIDIFSEIQQKSKPVKGFSLINEPPFLRHFTCRFKACS